MRDQYLDSEEESYSLDESGFAKTGSLRKDNELFNEQSNIPHTVSRVRRGTDGWNFSVIVEGIEKCYESLADASLTKKEIEFLKTVEGASMLVSMKPSKNLVKDVKSEIKKRLKK